MRKEMKRCGRGRTEGEQSEGEQSEGEQSEGEQSEGEQSEGEQSEVERWRKKRNNEDRRRYNFHFKKYSSSAGTCDNVFLPYMYSPLSFAMSAVCRP